MIRVIEGSQPTSSVEFRTYDLDTPSTFSQRVAAEFDTLPKYLIPPEVSLEAKTWKVENLLQTIKTNAEISTDFSEIRDKLNGLGFNLNTEKDVLHVWLVYNKGIDDLFKRRDDVAISKIAQELVKSEYFPKEESFKNFWKRDREVVKKRLIEAINFNKSVAETQEELYQTISSIEDAPVFLPLDIERVRLLFRLKIEETSLLELFNSLLMNEAVPFATCKQYYKILKDFVPPEEWSASSDDLTLKVSDKEIVNTTKFTDYTDVKITDNEVGGVNEVVAELKVNIVRGNLVKEQLIARALQPFSKGAVIEYDNVKETEIVGLFYFPQFRINPYVFADLVMNDSLFSFLISIDESVKATRQKTENSQPRLYLHFDHPNTGHVTAGLSQQIVQVGDPVIKKADLEIFPIGSPYLRVRVKGRDLQAIEKFQDPLSKLLAIYNQKHDEIETYYRKFIPDFGVIEEEKVVNVDLTDPKNIAPEIFNVPNYSRTCKDDRIPVIVTKKEAKKEKNMMKFPRDTGSDTPYPSDGVNQQYYVCTNPAFPYPGLQENNNENAKDYPFVPCCFAQPQTKKKIWKHYYLGEDLKPQKTKKQQDLIKTDKILDSEKYGLLPQELENVFELLDSNLDYKYIRIGVHRNHSSFLEAVMIGLHEETDILSHKDRVAFVNNARLKLSAPDIAPLCRQSVYDASIPSIQKNIENKEVYLDPNLYLQLLEEYFDCNIFLFNRKRLVLPRHLQSFQTMRREMKPCIFIYEHWGSESDHAKYPQCELIVRWQLKTTDTQYDFEYTEKVARGVRQMVSMLQQSYALDKPVEPTFFHLNSPLLSQRIDSYGKCRQIQVDFHHEAEPGKTFSLFTEPIPPQRVIEEGSAVVITRQTLQDTLQFIKAEEAMLIGQTVIDDILKEIKVKIGTVVFAIPVQETKPIENIDTERDISYPTDNKESKLVTYNKNKKVARYLVEYVYWLFSKFLHKKSKKDISVPTPLVVTDEVLAEFAKKRLVIVPKFNYPYIRKTFEEVGIIQNKKLIVTSDDMLKRLMYVLKLYSIRDIKSLVRYKDKKVIQNYYQDITDFFQHPKQVILHGEESVEKWIQESKISYTLHDGVVIGTRTPYFFKNQRVKDEVFLAQNIESIPKAVSIAMTWYKKGYNPSVYADDIPVVNFTLYSYVNPTDISAYKTTGGENSPRSGTKVNIRILGYKTNNTPFYTVLLPLH